ncbi:MAG TPA: hypothetical protein PKC96_03925 [Bacilli bacterium]|nr:hypothetical protein [Bacilli bacterium]
MGKLLGSLGVILLIGVLASSNIDLNQFFDFMGSIIRFFATIVVGIFQIFITIIETIL